MHRTVCRVTSVLALCLLIPSVWAFEIKRVSLSSAGEQANSWSDSSTISADGRFVAFQSLANNLVTGDTNGDIDLYRGQDIFVHDQTTGITVRVSVSSDGNQANSESYTPSISADGRFVAFRSRANNLVEGDTNGNADLFVHDRTTGITERVSVTSAGVQIMDESYSPSISANGRFVAFHSNASNLVADDTNGTSDVFVHDRDTGIVELVSVSSTGAQANYSSGSSAISADGRFVAFASSANNLVVDDTNVNNNTDIFVHDRTMGRTERVSLSSDGIQAKGGSRSPSISANGRFVAFISNARNLVGGDTNGDFNLLRGEDIFVHDRDTGMTERVNLSSNGYQAQDRSYSPTISADGRFVAFSSDARNLVTNDTNDKRHIYVHDRDTGITRKMSMSLDGVQARSLSEKPSISADGRFVAFESHARNLVNGDTNDRRDIFVTENNLLKLADDLSVSLRRTSGTTLVGEYIHFRARLINTTDQPLTNCKAIMINPTVNRGIRVLSFFSWPLNVSNPVTNGRIDIAPGETGQFSLAVLPRVAMRREISFTYACDTTQAYSIPFLNSIHLTAKTEPLISEDFVTLTNAYPKTQVVIDRSNGKYWTAYTLNVQNNGAQPANVNLGATSDLLSVPVRIRTPYFCEPVDPVSRDWSCLSPRAQQLHVDLAAGESKKIRVYVHAYRAIKQYPVKHRIIVNARDQAGKIVAKTSIGVSTLD